MKKYFLTLSLPALFLLATAVGSASPLCTSVTPNMAAFQALGSDGCTINNLLFNNFTYSYTLGTDAFYPGSGPKGTGAQQNASAVTVAINEANDELDFGANWIVNHYQTALLNLSFNVCIEVNGLCVDPPLSAITQLENAYTATSAGSQNGGPAATLAANCTQGTCGNPTDFTNATVAIAQTSGPLLISNSVTMNAQGSTNSSSNLYHLSIITDSFAALAGPTDIPEPFSMALIGSGLVGFALIRKRRK